MKRLAICMNIPEIQTNFRDKVIGKRYPGAGFLPHLAKLCDEAGIEITSGSALLNSVKVEDGDEYAAEMKRSRLAKDTLVLQEEFNSDGLRLGSLGAKAQVLICLESKMYAPWFYDQLPELKKYFKYQILYEGGTHPLHFPSYDPEDLYPADDWWSRKPLCMIASNKQWQSIQPPVWQSPSWCEAIRNELHTERLRAIAAHPEMDLYGHGWDHLDHLPPQWAYLKPQIQKQWKGVVEDKLATLRQYRRSVCYENTNLPGYITEKPIHCIAVGTIPIHNSFKNSREDISKYSNLFTAKQIMELVKE